ncbi:MAG: neutral zinc metallopeptidase [Myxococcota bacterium]|nr:neutral zinc metallopeptidase [Myxococcota bacterium]
MKWQTGRRSGNVIDRRGRGGPALAGGGLLTLIGVLFYLFTGQSVDPSGMQQGPPVDEGQGASGGAYVGSPEEEQLKEFVSVILADTEDTWPRLLAGQNVQYQEPRLVIFTGAVQSACGGASSAVGPFYCPADQQVYLDLSFFNELARMGGAGDFANAYVVAHEIGHHVQNLLGISEQTQQAQRRMDQASGNALSVQVELQADCFAGVWAHYAQRERQLLEPGDVEEGLAAAAAIGDDRLQREAGRRVSPETFTHGTSAHRMEWFQRGLKQGTVEACNTFR